MNFNSKCIKTAISTVLCIVMIVSALTLTANAVEKCPEIVGSNINGHQYDYNWSTVTRSYLLQTDKNTLMRFQADAVAGKYLVEYYSKDYVVQDFFYVNEELPIFGGFYATEDNYYVLSGQKNPKQSASVECFRITKYDLNWKRIDSAGLYNCNTTIPFDAGNARFAHYGKYLFVRTSHEMYADENGINHQSNVTIQLDTEKMEITDQCTFVANSDAGYISHSFNQFIHIENGKIVALDHGDAHLRAVALIKYPTDISTGKFFSWECETIQALPIPGKYGDNHTGVEVGGFEISQNNYLIAYSAVILDENFSRYNTKNVYITAIDKNTNKITTRKFTNYQEGEVGASDPYLVKISNTEFMLVWSVGDDVYCTRIDENGNQTDTIHKCKNEFLSDCTPIIVDGKLVWYTYKDELVTFYEINLSDYNVNITDIYSGHQMEICDEPNGPGDPCAIQCQKCGHTDSFDTGTKLMLYWNTDTGEGSYIMPLQQYSFKTGDRLYVMMNDETEVKHNEKIIEYSDIEAIDYTELNSNHGFFVFTKPGTHTVTISYKYNPNVKESFTFTVTGNDLYPDTPDNPDNTPNNSDKPDVPSNNGIGDINGNNKIDMTDYILLKRAYFGTYNFTDKQNLVGDINGNNKIDMTDYILLKRAYFGTYTI